MYISTPNTIEYHAYPIDCWRAYPDGMRALLDWAGLIVLECEWPTGTIDTNAVATK